MTNLVQSRWLDNGLILFYVCLWTLTMTHKHAKKNSLVNIGHQISCFVNNSHTITLHNCLEL